MSRVVETLAFVSYGEEFGSLESHVILVAASPLLAASAGRETPENLRACLTTGSIMKEDNKLIAPYLVLGAGGE
jgi:hypothetical protein